jgi:hypothetical protein
MRALMALHRAVRAEALVAEERLEREEDKAVRAEALSAEKRLEREKRQADKALQEGQDARVARAQQAEEVHYLDKTRAIGQSKACAAVAVACSS